MRYAVCSGYCAEDVDEFDTDSSPDPLGDAIARAKEIVASSRRTGCWVSPYIVNLDNADLDFDGLTDDERDRVEKEGF